MGTVISSIGLKGLTGYLVNVEVEMLHGTDQIVIVGLPDTSLKESKERIISALNSIDCRIPDKKVIINLAPADHKKNGPFFDLAMAVGILKCMDKINGSISPTTAFIGALSLQGRIQPIQGILPTVLAAQHLGIKQVYLPYDPNMPIPMLEGIELIYAETLTDVVNHLDGQATFTLAPQPKLMKDIPIFQRDFQSVLGHEKAKRALEIAAAGEHNLLMSGPPGCGKSMLAEAFPSILPPLSQEAQIEVMSIYQLAGADFSNDRTPPFRHPHHSSSSVALVGGGTNPKPGEVSLAHNGVLFLDEIAEFNKKTLDMLRQPLESGQVTISRVHSTVTYPSRFLLIAAMNPCPCGYFGSQNGYCICSLKQIQAYQAKVSGPILDRMDIMLTMNVVPFDKEINKNVETSEMIRKRVIEARQRQQLRYQSFGKYSNATVPLELLLDKNPLSATQQRLIQQRCQQSNWSNRVQSKIIKLARTISDLQGEASITDESIWEAFSLRQSPYQKPKPLGKVSVV